MTAPVLSASSIPTASAPTLDPLCARLRAQGFVELDADTLDAAAASDGNLVVLALDNPAQRPEFFDLAVVLPEILRQFAPGTFRAAFTRPPASAAIVRRFGVLRHPALIFLRAGRFVGTLEGLRDWQDYVQSFARMRTAAPKPVTIPLAVASSAAGTARAADTVDLADASGAANAPGSMDTASANAAGTVNRAGVAHAAGTANRAGVVHAAGTVNLAGIAHAAGTVNLAGTANPAGTSDAEATGAVNAGATRAVSPAGTASTASSSDMADAAGTPNTGAVRTNTPCTSTPRANDPDSNANDGATRTPETRP